MSIAPRYLRSPAILGILLAAYAVPLSAQTPPVAAHAPTGSEQRVPFAVGETLVYDVSWSSFVTAGQATLAVQERTAAAGSSAYHIVADGRPADLVSRLYNLYYKVESWLDAFNLLPRRSSTHIEEGGRTQTRVVTFDQRARKASYENGRSRKALSVPPLAQDPLSALYVVRTLRLGSGQQLLMPVVNNGEVHRVALTTAERESVLCGLGTVQAMRIDMTVSDAAGRRVGQNMAVWLTTGQRQVPVQMKADLPIGSFRLLLREARGL
jgi:uncharacterized protein DUF3108